MYLQLCCNLFLQQPILLKGLLSTHTYSKNYEPEIMNINKIVEISPKTKQHHIPKYITLHCAKVQKYEQGKIGLQFFDM